MGAMLKCDAPGSGPRARYDQTSCRAVMTIGAGGLIPRADYSEARFRAQELCFNILCAGMIYLPYCVATPPQIA